MKATNFKKLNILLLVAVALSLVAMILSSVYAIVINVQENYVLQSSSNTFTLSSGKYYETVNVAAGATSANVTVTNNILNTAYPNPMFDLVVYADDGVTVTLNGYTPTHYATALGECFIYRNVLHTYSDTTGSMTLDLGLSSAQGCTLKLAVLTSSTHNYYIADAFSLEMLTNETYHDIFYVDVYGEWEVAAEGAYSISGGRITIGDVGEITTLDVVASTLSGNITENAIMELTFDKLVFEYGLTVTGFDIMTLYYQEGYYYNPEYGLRIRLDSTTETAIFEHLPYELPEENRFVFFVDNVTTHGLLNFPCVVNLLYSTLTLDGELKIAFPAAGGYNFIGVPQEAVLNNDAASLVISTPRAYYTTGSENEGVEGFLTNIANFSKSCNVDFDAPENADLLSSLLSDAGSYVIDYLPSYVYNDIKLPASYHNHNITYNYDISNTAMDKFGKITRAEDNTPLTISVTIARNGVAVGDPLQKTVTVVGTSEEAKITALEALLYEYIGTASEISNGENRLTRALELHSFINTMQESLGIDTIFDICSGDVLRIFLASELSGDTIEYEGDELIVSDTGYVLKGKGAEVLSVAKADVTYIYIAVPDLVLDNSVENITINYAYLNGAATMSKVIAVTLKGMTLDERKAYIDRFIETLYITRANTQFDLLQLVLQEGAFYVGDLANNSKVIDSTLGVTAFSYAFYNVRESDYQSYLAGTMTFEELAQRASTTDVTSRFTIENGMVSVGSISTGEGEKIISVATATFGDEGSENYVREVIIPSSGLGGNDYTEYTRGDTFASYFNGLIDGKLIDSVAGVNAYVFAPFEDGVLMRMSIVNANDVLYDGVNSFCSLVYDESGNSYQIDIDVDNIPAQNTTVQIAIYFYLMISGEESGISEQDYSFIIPGIYKLGRDVEDAIIYQRMLEVYENFNNEYLLVDGANATVDVFDCSLATLTGASQDAAISLRGVELLKDTAWMIFDGIKVQSLSPFASFDSYRLTHLSLNNCSITDDIFTTLYGSYTGLYHLNTLTKIELDGNAISTLLDANGNSCLYRTVQEVSMQNQRGQGVRVLTQASGVEKLPLLSRLDISGNAIADFIDLIYCASLTYVDLADNLATEFANKAAGDTMSYYGSSGLINIPHMVALVDRGVTIVGDSDQLFTENERLASLILNAISVFATQYGEITFPALTYELTTGSGAIYTISITYALVSNSAVAYTTSTVDTERISVSSPSFVGGEKVSLIAEATVNGETAYKQFTFNYREVTS